MAPISKILSLSALALLAAQAVAAPVAVNQLAARQLAGEGQAFDSLFTDTDNGIGYGVENAEDNTANLITGAKGGSLGGNGGSSGSAPPPPPPKPHRRQLDKIANGFGNLANAAGLNAVGNPVVTYGDSIDGTLTGGAANAGAQGGSIIESSLENGGKAVPRV